MEQLILRQEGSDSLTLEVSVINHRIRELFYELQEAMAADHAENFEDGSVSALSNEVRVLRTMRNTKNAILDNAKICDRSTKDCCRRLHVNSYVLVEACEYGKRNNLLSGPRDVVVHVVGVGENYINKHGICSIPYTAPVMQVLLWLAVGDEAEYERPDGCFYTQRIKALSHRPEDILASSQASLPA